MLDIRTADNVHFFDVDYQGEHTRVIRVGRERWGARFRHQTICPKHYRAYFLVLAGHGALSYRKRVHALGPGHVFRLGTPWYGNETIVRDPSGMRVLAMSFVGRQAWVLERQHLGIWREDGINRQVFKPGNTGALVDCFEHCYAIVRDQGPYAQELALLQLQALLGTLRAGMQLTPAPQDDAYATYRRCRQHIERDYARLVDIRSVARATNIDPAYLSRLFKRFAGTTAIAHLQQVRLHQAAWLLLSSDRSITAIAEAVGYGSAAGFSRAFSARFGCSPDSYRRRE